MIEERIMKRLSGKIAAACLVFVLAAGVATRAQGPTFTVLHSFTGPTGDGAIPAAPVIMDAAGNLYGTTAFGGLTNCSVFGDVGCGTVFKLDPSGHETVLHMFSGGDGAFPAAGLLRDATGNLFGTTVNGGSAGFCRNFGCGTVFKLDPAGNLTVLHAFTGGSDGGNPTAGLITDVAGNLYGTTGFGGTFGNGTVFKLDASGNETVLHSFTGADGIEPSAPLIRDATGNLYSTAFRGGSAGSCNNFGCGTVFKLDPLGNLTVLHAFTGGSDGRNPSAGLARDPAGNLYGTTDGGGPADVGIVFKLDSLGNLMVLHAFIGGDGANVTLEGIPAAGLIRDAAGNLFGAAFRGGDQGLGTVFKLDPLLDPLHNLTVLHSFTGGSDGSGPLASLIMDAAGNLYGTASSFMVSGGFGTVFKLTIQETPPSVACTATPGTLWPPDGKPDVVTVSGTVTQGTQPIPVDGVTFAVIDEYGLDQPQGSVTVGTGGNFSFTLSLIAERHGDDFDGRTYTINVSATDAIGKVGVCSIVVTVPHDQGN